MQQTMFLKISSLLLLLILSFVGCTATPEPVMPEVIREVEYIRPDIPLMERPRALDLNDITFHVVNAENIEEFLSKIEQEQGVVVFFAITVDDYENLSLNMSDIKRYIEQQKSIIIYYEQTLRISSKEEDDVTN